MRDATTGQLRAPTGEEAQALQQSRSSKQLRAAPAAMLPRQHVNGTRGARLTDDMMSYSVVVKRTDGSLQEICFDSREAAEAALKASPPVPKNDAPTE